MEKDIDTLSFHLFGLHANIVSTMGAILKVGLLDYLRDRVILLAMVASLIGLTFLTCDGGESDRPDFSYLWKEIKETAQVDLLQKLSIKDPAFFHSLASETSLRSHLLGLFLATFGVFADTTVEVLSKFEIDRMQRTLEILRAGQLDVTYLSDKVHLLKTLSTRSKKDRLDVLFYSEEQLLRKKEDVGTQKAIMEVRIAALKKEIEELEQLIPDLDRQLGAITAERTQLLGDVKKRLGQDFDKVVATSLGEFLC